MGYNGDLDIKGNSIVMASVIRVLSEQTINQIAAGEVIENPASVVKELVENSLDAGATEIHVEIQGGGRQLIRVTDNGLGMTADDAVLCLERHATSKLKQVDDLHSLTTLGFRGEALPSIASISKFTLMTCPQAHEGNGTLVMVDGGQIIKCCAVVRSPGTTVEVKSLFFNVPVRKKFLRSPTYDSQEILKVLTCLSLGHPTITFQLVSSQKVVLNALKPQNRTLSEQFHERIAQVLGTDFLAGMCSLENVRGEDQLSGYIGLPAYNRHNRTGQFLFINKRHVQSPLVSFAVKEGYGPTLPTNRYPVYVLHLTIPGSIVDINVHPQKRDVRLYQEQLLRELITKGVEKSLQKSGYSRSMGETERPIFERPSFSQKREYPFAPLHESMASYKPSSMPIWSPPSNVSSQVVETPSFLDQDSSLNPIPPIQILTTLAGYIIVDPITFSKGGGLCLVDQRAAHARILYEKLLESHQKGSCSLPAQTLLFPYTFDVNALVASLLREHIPILQAFGLAIKEFGPHTFMIDAIPQLFGNTAIEELVQDLLSRLQDKAPAEPYKRELERELALAASHAAISKSKRLAKEEAQLLVTSLMQCKTPYQCPQGHPTILTWNLDDLSKQFFKQRS